MGDTAVAEAIIQMVPAVVLGLIYAAVVFVVARKRHINPWGWTIAAAVPVIGLIVAAVFWLLTLFSILDRLNRLEAEAGR